MQQLSTKLESISPKKAALYLEQNKVNRPIRRAWVGELARMIETGRFITTHQGIALGFDGSLKDGQHRLMAIVRANKEVKMFVSRGLSEGALNVIDSGKNRSIKDVLILSGHSLDMFSVSIGRKMMVGFGNKSHKEVNRVEVIEFITRHEEAITFSRQHSNSSGQFRNASLRAPVARAWYTQDRTRLAQFLEVLISGFPKGDADNAAIHLRNYFLRISKGSKIKFADREMIYAKTEYALRMFLDKTPTVAAIAAKEELFPFVED